MSDEPEDAEEEEPENEYQEREMFFGLDLSTRSMKGTLMNPDFNIVVQYEVYFDHHTSYYKTKNGVNRDPPDVGDKVFVNPVMWAEALDRLLEMFYRFNWNLWNVVAISCGGMPGGTVFWKRGSSDILKSLDPEKTLVGQLRRAFATNETPVWLDNTNTKQCVDIEFNVGGPVVLAKLTGCRALERCTTPQILKIYQDQPEVYENTERISLPSSFLASRLMGGYACIDESDAAGMNLMDLKKRTWSQELLEATAPGLEAKLGKIAPSHAVAGPLCHYFLEKHRFNEKCVVIQSSGDIACSLPALVLDHGDLGISLGTNDTVFALTKDPQATMEGQNFPSPVEPEDYMVTLTYKNGALTREDVLERYCGKSWNMFNEYLDKTPPLNDGKMGFYYKDKEFQPPCPAGYYRYQIENFTGETLDGVNDVEVEEEFGDKKSEVRAMMEGQLLSMRAHAERIGIPHPKRVIVAGQASKNKHILKLIADVFGCDVYTHEKHVPGTVSAGAALRACHGWTCHKKGFVPISSCYQGKVEDTTFVLEVPVDLEKKYALLMKKRMEIERKLVEKTRNPDNH